MSQMMAKHPLEKTQAALMARLQIVIAFALLMQSRLAQAWAVLTGEAHLAAPTAAWRSSPLTSGSTLLSFDPALADEIGETKAIILQKVWDWMEYNRTEGKMDHCIDGQWYSYNSAREWRDAHFWHLSVATIKATFQWLEEKGYVQRIQHHKDRGDCRMWVTIPAESRSRIDAISAVNTPDKKTPMGDKNVTALGEKDSPTKENLQIENQHIKTPKISQTTTELQDDVTDAVDVVCQPSPDPESESGEHSINGEGHDTTAVKAFMPHEQHHDEQPFPKVAQKGFPALAAELVAFGVLPPTAQRLVGQYPEADVRYILGYSRLQTTLTNPPGFVVDELDTGKHGVLATRGIPAPAHRSLSAVLAEDTEREERMRRETERLLAAEEAERAADDCEVNV